MDGEPIHLHRAQEEPVLCPWAVVVFVVVVVVFIHEIVLVRAGATSLFLINKYTLVDSKFYNKLDMN